MAVRYTLPPGPNPDSNEADFVYNEKQIYKKLSQKYIPKYGPIITLYKEETPCIMINDIDVAFDIFVNNSSKKAAGRQASYGERLLSGNNNNILNTDYGPVWKILQRYLHRGLRYCANYDRLNEIMERAFSLFKNSIQERKGSKASGIKVEEDLFWMSDNVMTLLLFNEIFRDQEYEHLTKVMAEIISKIDYTDFDRPKDASDQRAVQNLQTSVNKLFVIIQKRLDEHKKRGDYKISCLDITDFILLGVEECHLDPVARKLKVQLSDIHVKHTIIDAMFASQEGLGNTFNWIVGLLALNPQIQDRIRSELFNFKDDKQTPLSLFWKSKMPYTNAVLCELQRFACADTMSDFHKALDDIYVKGTNYIIPKGSLLLLNIYGIHYDPRRWQEPNQIIPERFLSPDGSRFKRRKDFVPYGLGLRTCTGNVLSENILFLLILHLVDQYRLVWPASNKQTFIQDDKNASFIRDMQPFNIQFVPLK